MRLPGARPRANDEVRHWAHWYDDLHSDDGPTQGERMFIRCEGGPCLSRLETFPPRLEIQERGGHYVLVDDGPVDEWTYQFAPTFDR
jgi:hypothetical protein